jgi:hypothetical protein
MVQEGIAAGGLEEARDEIKDMRVLLRALPCGIRTFIRMAR